MSSKHNKLIANITSDIDKVHTKRLEVQDMITRTTNYLSTERVSINNAVSKMQARIVNQQLRSAMNDKHLVVFTEYFTDDNYVDKALSQNVQVDTSLSALTLLPTSTQADNSNLIDPSTIFLQVELDTAIDHDTDSLYPVSEAKANQSYIAAFGRTLNDDTIQTQTVNYNSAGYSEPSTYLNIQKQCLQVGSNGGADQFTHGEFELVLNDFDGPLLFPKIQQAIKKASIAENHTSIDSNHIVFDVTQGNSFGGAKRAQSSPGTYFPTDTTTIFNKIKSVGLSFSLIPGTLTGFISYILINFFPTANSLNVPEIDYEKSFIKDDNGQLHTFTEMTTNSSTSLTNVVTETRYLAADSMVENPISVYIAFKKTSLTPADISSYTGTYWKVRMSGTSIVGLVQLPGSDTPTSVSGATSYRYLYLYMDPVRVSAASQVSALNLPILNSIISVYKASLAPTVGS